MKNKRNRFGRLLWKAFWYGIATVSLSIVFYGLTALFFSTPEEKRLIRENRMYRDLYPDLLDKERLLGDVVEGLQVLDVHGGDDVDARVQQLGDVLPALRVPGPGGVGVRELVDHRDLRGAGEDRVQVHLRQRRTPKEGIAVYLFQR